MLGERIREIRMEMGLTAKELAQRASVTPGYISQIEHDQIKPSMNVMMRIAEVLNVPLGTVKSRLHTAVEQFANLWKSANPTPG